MSSVDGAFDADEGNRDLVLEEDVRMSEEPDYSEEFKFEDVHSGESFVFAETEGTDFQHVNDDYEAEADVSAKELNSRTVASLPNDIVEEQGLKVFDEDLDLAGAEHSEVFTEDEDALAPYEEFDELDTQRGAISRFLRPDGEHLNKVGIGFVLGVVFFAVFGISMLMGDDKKDSAKKNTEKDSSTVEATQVNSENLNPMLNEKEIVQSKTGGDSNINLDGNKTANVDSLLQSNSNVQDPNMLQQASTMNGGVAPGQTMPQTMTSTKTTVSEVPMEPSYSTGGTTTGGGTTTPVYRNNSTQRQETEGGAVVMRRGRRIEEQNDLNTIQNANRNQSEDAGKTLALPYGTRIILELNDPVRSGIETSVQAKSLAAVRDTGGNVIIPIGSTFEITFNPQEVNGRVFAQEVIKWVSPNGDVYALKGSVKGGDGFEGITGKIVKQNGKGVGGKIIGGLKRVGGTIIQQVPGGSEVNSVLNEDMYGNSDRYSYSNRIVEIAAGTRILLTTK
jgi:hypothetical protein